MFVVEVRIDGQVKYLSTDEHNEEFWLLPDPLDGTVFRTRDSVWNVAGAYIDSYGFPDEVESITIKEV